MEVGDYKYKGAVCLGPDEAKASAAAMANISLKPVSQMLVYYVR